MGRGEWKSGGDESIFRREEKEPDVYIAGEAIRKRSEDEQRKRVRSGLGLSGCIFPEYLYFW